MKLNKGLEQQIHTNADQYRSTQTNTGQCRPMQANAYIKIQMMICLMANMRYHKLFFSFSACLSSL